MARPSPEERTRRRFVRRQWARRLLGARRGLIALAVLVVIGFGVYAVWFSPWLSVSKVEVSGTSQLSARQVEQAAQVPQGEPLINADLEAVRRRVEAMAMVDSAEVTRSWPNAVRIAVTERQAIAVVRIGGAIRGMDADGVVFRSYRTAPVGLPMIETSIGTNADALAEAARVVTSLPEDVAPKVDHVTVETIDEISLVLRDGRTVVWGSSAESALKGQVLGVLLRQPGRTFDVSVPSRPTTR